MIRKTIGLSLLGLVWASLAVAQEAPEVPEAAAEAEPAAQEAPADTEASTESGAEAREPRKLYGGIELDVLELSLSDAALRASLGGNKLESSMLRLRGGMRFFDVVGLELQLGSGLEDAAPGKFGVGSYAGVFVVPTGTLFDVVEVAGIIGITRLEAEGAGEAETLNGQAYGVNVELPLRVLAASMPDLRAATGYTVFNANNRHRTYGLHFGLRYDFQW